MGSMNRCVSVLVALLLTSVGIQVSGAASLDSQAVQHKVIIDTDMGQFNDDAVTLFMLANSPNVEILGLTIVAGNTWVQEGTAYALRQLEIINRPDIPVLEGLNEPLMGSRQSSLNEEQSLFGNSEYLGAYNRPQPDSYEDIGTTPYGGYAKTEPSDEHAVDFIVRRILENPDEITLLALGPPTNIALAVKKNPEIVPLVKRIIYMGGAIDIPGNTTPAAEFNWWFDPEATRISLRTPFKEQLVVPNDIAERVFYTKARYESIVSAPETRLTRMLRHLEGDRWQKYPDARIFVWDAIVAAILLKPEIATRIEKRYIDIDTNFGPNYGRSIGYHESRRRSMDSPDNFPVGSRKVDILFDIDRTAFWALYVDLLTKEITPNNY